MRRNRQLIVDRGHGDCFRASLTSILGIPNDPALPGGGDPEWYLKWLAFLGQFGLTLRFKIRACWSEGYWIASVPSLNLGDGVTHAIVMHDSEVAHDPTTAKTYPTGESLLGKDVVQGGWNLEVTDPTLLGGLVKIQTQEPA